MENIPGTKLGVPLLKMGLFEFTNGRSILAVSAFVPLHGCSRQHNRSLRFFLSHGSGTIKES